MSAGVGKMSSAQTPFTGAAQPTRAEASAQAEAARRRSVEVAAQRLQSHAQSMGRSLEFRVDRSTGSTVVTVKDTTSGEVIRQIPNEEALWLAEHIDQQAALLRTEV
jgi:flagellar protein FlaG